MTKESALKQYEEQEEYHKPERYTGKSGMDTIDRIRDVFGSEVAEHFCIGNIYKYLDRMYKKDTPESNLRKIREYSERALEEKGK